MKGAQSLRIFPSAVRSVPHSVQQQESRMRIVKTKQTKPLSQRGQVDLSPRNGGSRGVCVKLLSDVCKDVQHCGSTLLFTSLPYHAAARRDKSHYPPFYLYYFRDVLFFALFFLYQSSPKQGPSLVLEKNAKSGSEFFFWVSRGFGPWGACLGFFGFSELYPHCGGVISEKWTSS